MKKALFIIFLLGTAAMPCAAAAPKKIGQYGHWTAYVLKEGKNPVCYMSLAAKPPVRKKAKTKRANVVLMVTHRPAESVYDVVSYAAGAKFGADTQAIAKVDGKEFVLFTKGDTAWARDFATDSALARALRKGYSVTVRGKLASGERFADEVSLKGSNNAYKAISKACSVPAPPLSD